jgi:hypothetical protein
MYLDVSLDVECVDMSMYVESTSRNGGKELSLLLPSSGLVGGEENGGVLGLVYIPKSWDGSKERHFPSFLRPRSLG